MEIAGKNRSGTRKAVAAHTYQMATHHLRSPPWTSQGLDLPPAISNRPARSACAKACEKGRSLAVRADSSLSTDRGRRIVVAGCVDENGNHERSLSPGARHPQCFRVDWRPRPKSPVRSGGRRARNQPEPRAPHSPPGATAVGFPSRAATQEPADELRRRPTVFRIARGAFAHSHCWSTGRQPRYRRSTTVAQCVPVPWPPSGAGSMKMFSCSRTASWSRVIPTPRSEKKRSFSSMDARCCAMNRMGSPVFV